MNKTENKRYNTIQAAKELGIKPGTLAKWRSTGESKLRYKKIGRLVYYYQRDIDNYLDDCSRCHTGER